MFVLSKICLGFCFGELLADCFLAMTVMSSFIASIHDCEPLDLHCIIIKELKNNVNDDEISFFASFFLC